MADDEEIYGPEDVMNTDHEFEHDVVWVVDPPKNNNDLGTHAYVFDVKDKKKYLVSRNHMYNVTVKVLPKLCSNCDYLFFNACEKFNFIPPTDKGFGCTGHNFI